MKINDVEYIKLSELEQYQGQLKELKKRNAQLERILLYFAPFTEDTLEKIEDQGVKEMWNELRYSMRKGTVIQEKSRIFYELQIKNLNNEIMGLKSQIGILKKEKINLLGKGTITALLKARDALNSLNFEEVTTNE